LFSDSPAVGDFGYEGRHGDDPSQGRSSSPWLRKQGLRIAPSDGAGQEAPNAAAQNTLTDASAVPGAGLSTASRSARISTSLSGDLRSSSVHASPRPPTASPAKPVRLGAGSSDAMRRQLEALEERLGASIGALQRQQLTDRQEADSLAELSRGRLEDRLGRAEQQQVRLERRLCELAGQMTGFDNQAQERERRMEQLQDRFRTLQVSLAQEQEMWHQRVSELGQDHKALAASFQAATNADEEAQRRHAQRVMHVEHQLEEQVRALEAVGREANTLSERLEVIEASRVSNTSAQLDMVSAGDHNTPAAIACSTDGEWPQQPAGDEAFVAVQELQGSIHQELQAIHERCNFVQDIVDERVLGQIRKLERKVGDHDMKVEQLLVSGQDCTAKIEEHEVRLGVTRSKLDTHDERLALVSDRLDRTLKAEKAASSSSLLESTLRLGSATTLPPPPPESSDIDASKLTLPSSQALALWELRDSQRELRGRVDACERQLSCSGSIVPGAQRSLSTVLGDSGQDTEGSLSRPLYERRLQSVEGALDELRDICQQQESASVKDGHVAAKALAQADTAAARLEDLGAQLRRIASSIGRESVVAPADFSESLIACENSLRREMADRLLEVAQHAQIGFTDIRGHLDAISEQFAQLRDRVGRHEETLNLSNRAEESSAEISDGLPELEVRMSQNEALTAGLSRNLINLHQVLKDVKQSIDIAVAERQASLSAPVNTRMNIQRTEILKAADSIEASADQDVPSNGFDEGATIDQRVSQVEDKAGEAERRAREAEVAATSTHRRLDDLSLSFASLPARLSTFEDRLLRAESHMRPPQQDSAGQKDLLNTESMQAVMADIQDLDAKIGQLSLQWDSILSGVDVNNGSAATKFGMILHELPSRTDSLDNALKRHQESSSRSLQQLETKLTELLQRMNSREEAEEPPIVQRLEHAEHELEELRRIFQCLEQAERDVEAHRKTTLSQHKPAELTEILQRLDQAEQQLESVAHAKPTEITDILQRLGPHATTLQEIQSALQQLRLGEKELQERKGALDQCKTRLDRTEHDLDEQKSLFMALKDKVGHVVSRVAALDDSAHAVGHLQHELALLRGHIERHRMPIVDSMDGSSRMEASDMGEHEEAAGGHRHRPVDGLDGQTTEQDAEEAAGGHRRLASMVDTADIDPDAEAAGGRHGTTAPSHIEDAEAGGGGPSTAAIAVAHAEAGGGGPAHSAARGAEAAGGGPTLRASQPSMVASLRQGGSTSSSNTLQPHAMPSRWEGAEAETSAGMPRRGDAEAETSAGPSPTQARRIQASSAPHRLDAEAETSAGPSGRRRAAEGDGAAGGAHATEGDGAAQGDGAAGVAHTAEGDGVQGHLSQRSTWQQRSAPTPPAGALAEADGGGGGRVSTETTEVFVAATSSTTVDADLDGLLEDLATEGAETAGGPGPRASTVFLANAEAGGGQAVLPVSPASQAAGGGEAHLKGDVAHAEASDTASASGVGADPSVVHAVVSDGAALTGWHRLASPLLSRDRANSEPGGDGISTPTSDAAAEPERRGSRSSFSISGPAVSQRGEVLEETSCAASREGSWASTQSGPPRSSSGACHDNNAEKHEDVCGRCNNHLWPDSVYCRKCGAMRGAADAAGGVALAEESRVEMASAVTQGDDSSASMVPAVAGSTSAQVRAGYRRGSAVPPMRARSPPGADRRGSTVALLRPNSAERRMSTSTSCGSSPRQDFPRDCTRMSVRPSSVERKDFSGSRADEIQEEDVGGIADESADRKANIASSSAAASTSRMPASSGSAACNDTTLSSFALEEDEDPLARLGFGDSDQEDSDGAQFPADVEELLDSSEEDTGGKANATESFAVAGRMTTDTARQKTEEVAPAIIAASSSSNARTDAFNTGAGVEAAEATSVMEIVRHDGSADEEDSDEDVMEETSITDDGHLSV
jgi:chromosome segregation ATPase